MQSSLSALESRVPPPVLLIALAALVYACSPPPVSMSLRFAVGLLLIASGLGINAWPKASFRRAGTTVNPLRPDQSSVLVTSGLYRFSRNPMYLGYAIALLGWVVCLGAPFGLLAVVTFAAYITRFQIFPEERSLSARFPMEYAAYAKAVRRWL